MKKTAVRKIRLNRETLRQLDPQKLTEPQGGATITACWGSCVQTCTCGATKLCTITACSVCC